MKSFKVARRVIISQFFVVLVLFAMFFLLGGVFFMFGFGMPGELRFLGDLLGWLRLGFIFMIGSILVALCFLGLQLYTTLQAQLVFTEHSLALVAPDRFRRLIPDYLRSFSVDYDQISLVRRNGRILGVLDLLDSHGKIFKLSPPLFGKASGAEVLDELRNHLPPECFEAGLDARMFLPQWSRAERIIMITVAIIYLLVLVLTVNKTEHWFFPAWNVEYRSAVFESVWAYSVDQKTGFWIVASKAFDGYTAYHFPNVSDQTWTLPTLGDQQYPDQVSGDANGLPLIWLDDAILRYRDGGWVRVPYQGATVSSLGRNSAVVSGEQGWLIDRQSQDEDYQFFEVDALSGRVSPLALPANAVQQGLSPTLLRRAINGDLLVLAQKETAAHVYLLSGGQWQAQDYPVILVADSWVRDLFLDAENALWVLFGIGDEWFVEKVNPAGGFQLTRLPAFVNEENWHGYSTLLVDARQRLWVSGSYPEFMAVLKPEWQGDAGLLQRYRTVNSNFPGGIIMDSVVSKDGRLWAFDDYIASIDTNLPELPAPLPGWAAFLNENISNIWATTGFIYLVVMAWITWRQRQFLPKKPKSVLPKN